MSAKIKNSAEEKRMKAEKYALNLSMYGGLVFVTVEFLMALYTKSQAILMDSVYDAAELIMIIASIRIIPLLYRPTTEKHPFGFSQVEAIFITIKGSMLIAVTVGLVLNNIQIMLDGGRSVSFISVAYFQFFATGLSLIIILFLRRLNKRLRSPMVRTEADGWLIDTIASFGMAVAFLLPVFIQTDWMAAFAPYLDQVVAIVLSVFILPVPIKTVLSGLRDIFLLSPGEDTTNCIKEASTPILAGCRYTPTAFDIIKTGRKLWISIYFRPDGDNLSIAALKGAEKSLYAALKEQYPDLYLELVPETE